MPFKKGQSGNKAGKPPGAINRYSKELAEKMHADGFTQPLDILLMIANDTSIAADIRAKAAKDASPYVHRRKPQAMEITGKFEFLSPEEREMRRSLLVDEIRTRRALNSVAVNN